MAFQKFPAGTQLKTPSGSIMVADGNTEYNTDYVSPVGGSPAPAPAAATGPTVSTSFISNVQNQLRNGQISVADAKNAVKSNLVSSYGNSALSDDGLQKAYASLFSGLGPIKGPDGQIGYVDGSYNFIKGSTDVHQSNVSVGGGTSTTTTQQMSFPTTNLQPGSTGSDVQRLQQFLVSQGFMSQADMNTGPGIYGPKTTAAVQAWQQAKGVDNSSGPGYWGPKSIATATAITTSNQGGSASGGSGAPAGGSSSNFSGIENSDPFLVDLLKDPANKAMYDSLPDSLKGIFLSTVSSLTKAVSDGQVVNPNIDITPEKAKEFLDQATSELDPYYKEQAANLKTDFQTSVDRLMEDYNKGVNRASDTLKTNLQDQSNNEADAGTVYSSGRADRQNRTLTLANNAVQDSATAASRAAQDNATTFGRQLGPMAFNGMNVPYLPTFSAGENGFTQTGNRSLYAPVSDSAIGSMPASEKVAVAGRASQLESAYRSGRNLDLSTLS